MIGEHVSMTQDNEVFFVTSAQRKIFPRFFRRRMALKKVKQSYIDYLHDTVLISYFTVNSPSFLWFNFFQFMSMSGPLQDFGSWQSISSVAIIFNGISALEIKSNVNLQYFIALFTPTTI